MRLGRCREIPPKSRPEPRPRIGRCREAPPDWHGLTLMHRFAWVFAAAPPARRGFSRKTPDRPIRGGGSASETYALTSISGNRRAFFAPPIPVARCRRIPCMTSLFSPSETIGSPFFPSLSLTNLLPFRSFSQFIIFKNILVDAIAACVLHFETAASASRSAPRKRLRLPGWAAGKPTWQKPSAARGETPRRNASAYPFASRSRMRACSSSLL